MDQDDDEGVGFISESHFLKSPSIEQQQAMSLLSLPGGRVSRDESVSSNISDIDIPIYSTETLTTRAGRPVGAVSLI